MNSQMDYHAIQDIWQSVQPHPAEWGPAVPPTCLAEVCHSNFLTFDTRQAGREVEDKWFKDRGILMLSQFPGALWPTQGHRIPEYSWGTGSRIPPSCRCQHPWILKVPSSWTSVPTDSESADMDSQLYLFLKRVFLMILEGHELFITMEGLFSFSSSEFIGKHGEWQL